MSNNRLYIANTNSSEYMMLCKGWGNGWGGVYDKGKFSRFLNDADHSCETDVGGKTGFIMFTEYDTFYMDVVEKNSGWSEYEGEP